MTRIKEDVENEAREVAYGLKNKCNASIKRATETLDSELKAIKDRRIFYFNQEVVRANPQWNDVVQKAIDEKVNVANLPSQILQHISSNVITEIKESVTFKDHIVKITGESSCPNTNELTQLILQSNDFKTMVKENTPKEKVLMDSLMPMIENCLQRIWKVTLK